MGCSFKRQNELVSLMHFKKISQKEENQIKYRLTKVVNFTIIPLKIF